MIGIGLGMHLASAVAKTVGGKLTLQSADGAVTHNPEPSLFGKLTNPDGDVSGVTIYIYKTTSGSTTTLGTATTDSDGNWSYAVGSDLSDGDIITAEAELDLASSNSVTYAATVTKYQIATDALHFFIGDSISCPSGTGEGQSLAGSVEVASHGLVNFTPMVQNVAGASTPLGTLGSSGSRINTGGTPATGQLTYLLANYTKTKILWVHSGTNDLVQGSETAASMLSDMDTLISQARAGGIEMMIINTILPRAYTDAYTTDMETKRLDYNAGLFDRAADDVIIVDHSYYDKSWNYSNASGDELHPKPYGAKQVAEHMLTALLEKCDFVAASAYDLFASNGLTNPTFTGTSGSLATGLEAGSVAPNNWTIDNDTGATVTSSIVTDGNGRRGVQLDVSGSATSASSSLRLYQVPSATITANTTYPDGMIEAHITGADGTGEATGLKGYQLYVSGSYLFTTTEDTVAYGPMPNPGGLCRALPKVPTSSSSLLNFSFQITFNVGAVAARITLWQPIANVKTV